MISTYLKKMMFLLFLIILAFFITFVTRSIAEEGTGTISGRVIDIDGHPIPKLPIFIAPLEYWGEWSDTVFLPYDFAKLHRTETNGVGQFTVAGIPQGPIYMGLLPHNIDQHLSNDFEKNLEYIMTKEFALQNPDYIDAFISNNFGLQTSDFQPDVEILSLSVDDITIYPRNDSDEIAFGIDPGVHIENIEVRVKKRMRVQGRALFKDGTPLANTRLQLDIKFRHENGSGGSGGKPWTDAEGYFIHYLDEKNHTALFTFRAEYQELETTLEPVHLDHGDRLDGITFTFNSEPIAPKPLPNRVKIEVDMSESPPAPEPPSNPKSYEEWIVNPINGHAYKRIYSKTRADAIVQATQENAHLVTINDAKEQEWLSAVFGNEFYWIGLSNTQKERKWQWINDEPITYENWLPDDYFSETWDSNERDYVVTTVVDGKWYAVSPKSVIVKMTEMSIIEKTDMKIKQSSK